MGGRQGLVEGKANGLDGDVGRAWLLQERSQNARRYVSTSADGDHQLRLELFENSGSCFLTQFVDLVVGHILLDDHLECGATGTG